VFSFILRWQVYMILFGWFSEEWANIGFGANMLKLHYFLWSPRLVRKQSTCVEKKSFKPQTGLRMVLDIIWRCQSYHIRLCNYIFAKHLYMFLNLDNTKQKTYHTPGASELRVCHLFPVAECPHPGKHLEQLQFIPIHPGQLCLPTWDVKWPEVGA